MTRKYEICITLLIVIIASQLIPLSIFNWLWPILQPNLEKIGSNNFYYLISLIFSIFLIANRPFEYGFRIGNIKSNIIKVLIVCGTPIILTAIVYPFTSKPFSGEAIGVWLISPLSQDIIFSGFIYYYLEKVFPGQIKLIIPINKCLFIGGIYFMCWHLSNLFTMNVSYVIFQLLYTFLAYVFTGLSRQWTGSFLYITAFHMSANYIACIQ